MANDLVHALRRPARPIRGGRPRRRVGLPRALDHETFLGVLSHELRTPITTIYGGAQILATRQLTDARRRTLAEDVSIEAERLYRIVEDLVAMLRSERGLLRSVREPVAVAQLVVAAIIRERTLNPGARIEYRGVSDAAVDEADEVLVGHVVRNLLDNAIRHSPDSAPIEVIVDCSADEVAVRMLDQGPRLNAPDQHSATESPATRTGLAGGGLGLFVAARLVQTMDGRSWAKPGPRGGAEFGFALPRSRSTGGPSDPTGPLRPAADVP